MRTLRDVVLRTEQSPDLRRETKKAKVVAIHQLGGLGFDVVAQVARDDGDLGNGEIVKHVLRSVPQIEIVGIRHWTEQLPILLAIDLDDTIGARQRRLVVENGAHEAERRRVCTDAESERQQ